MSERGVESGRYQHDIRLEVPRDRHHNGSEGGQVLGIAQRWIQPSGPGNVDVEPKAGAGSALGGATRSREEVSVVVAMDGQVEDARIVVEYLLRSVAVVDVPIDDQYPLDFRCKALPEQFGRDGYRVEEAEAHGGVRFRVVTRRSNHGESVPDFSFGGLVGKVYDTAGGHPGSGRRVVFVPGGVQVDSDAATSQPDETDPAGVHLLAVDLIRSEEKGMRFRVHGLQFFLGGLSGAELIATRRKTRLHQPSPDALEPAAVFRVGGVVSADAGVLQHEAIEGQSRGGFACLMD